MFQKSLCNFTRLNRLLEEERLDGLIMSTPENVLYLTGFWSIGHWKNRGAQLYAVYPSPKRNSRPALILGAGDLAQLADVAASWKGEVYVYGRFFHGVASEGMTELECRIMDWGKKAHKVESLAEGLFLALKDSGLIGLRIGLDYLNINPTVLESFQDLINDSETELVDGGNLITKARAVKTMGEIEALHISAKITEEGMAHLLTYLRPGMSEEELMAEFQSFCIKRGAQPCYCVLVCGPRSAVNTAVSGYRIQVGDLLRLDLGCIYRGYYSDTCRMASLGKPKSEVSDIYKIILKGQQASVNAVRAGVKAKEIFLTGVELIRKQGIFDYNRHHCGHGIGLLCNESPEITPNSTTLLEEGMVVNIETPYYKYGLGGVAIEDTIVVTAEGYRYLTELNRDLFIL